MELLDFQKSYERDERGFTFLVLRCIRDRSACEAMEVVADIPLAELCSNVGAATDFADARHRLVLVNGWQSWSFSGELAMGERPRRAILKPALNLFVDHPAEEDLRALARQGRSGVAWLRRPDIVSHFYVVLRLGNDRLALVSHNVGENITEANRALPPVTFFVSDTKVRVAVFADNGSFNAGETIARIAILSASDYFDLKDRLAVLFAAAERFDELAFLGADVAGREPVGGFETWYNHYLDIDESIILRDLATLETNGNLVNSMFLERGKPVIFQIDDGWEKCVGDWQPHNVKFPLGMADIAARIEAKGCIPGLWLAPFLALPESATAREHPEWILRDASGKPVLAGWNPGWGGDVVCLDLSLQAVEEYLVTLFETIVNVWGYRYLKLDFLFAGMLRGAQAGAKGGTWEHYRRVLKRITSMKRSSNGQPVAWLSCGAPFESTADIMPLMRIGADTKEDWDWPLLRLIGHQGRPSAKVNLSHTLARSLLDATLLLNDPDVIFCRCHKTSLTDGEKFLIGLVARMFASQILVSDDPSEFGMVHGKAGSLSEPEFTRELLALYEKLGGKEFGVERYSLASCDIYRFFSRDGSVHGIINLSDRDQALTALVPRHSLEIFGLP
ncbi:MAG: alpha-galactosidase [Rectinemataceae bacterium]|nr:alpha-galactosidase [Rectinemataceae bacterium]